MPIRNVKPPPDTLRVSITDVQQTSVLTNSTHGAVGTTICIVAAYRVSYRVEFMVQLINDSPTVKYVLHKNMFNIKK